MLRDLFGNPADDSFPAWLADHGVWAILIVAGALITWYLVRRYIRGKLLSAVQSLEGGDEGSTTGRAVRGLDQFFATVLPAAIIGTAAAVGITLVLGRELDGLWDFLARLGPDIGDWFVRNGLPSGFRIFAIIVAAWVGMRLSRRLIPPLMMKVIRDSRDAADRAEASRKRADTLGAVFVAAINVIIVVIAIFTVLSEFSVPIGPVLGGVGIAGIAVGFGAQYLVRDVITGTLILLENQYRQGDVVQIAGIAGLVESINLRRTVLRDLEGKVHTIPHGEITTTSNFTKYWSRVVLDVGVAYKEDMTKVFEVLNEIGTELGNHPELGLKVIDPPKVLRLNSFDDSQITIRMLGVCKPLTQWELAGWMRLRIKERFDEEGIEIPFPHQSVYWGVDQPPLPWQQPAAALDKNGEVTDSGVPEPAETPDITPDDFVDPTVLTPEQREQMLAEMALAAQAAQGQMLQNQNEETRLPGEQDD